MKNLLGTLLLSQGTPMLTAGDEFGGTQRGDNNAYCQDNEISWVDWNFGAEREELRAFVARLTELRGNYAVLRRTRFFTGEWNEEIGVRDLTWIAPSGSEMSAEQWSDPFAKCMGALFDGRAQATGVRRRGSDTTMLLIVNATATRAVRCRAWRRDELGSNSSTPIWTMSRMKLERSV